MLCFACAFRPLHDASSPAPRPGGRARYGDSSTTAAAAAAAHSRSAYHRPLPHIMYSVFIFIYAFNIVRTCIYMHRTCIVHNYIIYMYNGIMYLYHCVFVTSTAPPPLLQCQHWRQSTSPPQPTTSSSTSSSSHTPPPLPPPLPPRATEGPSSTAQTFGGRQRQGVVMVAAERRAKIKRLWAPSVSLYGSSHIRTVRSVVVGPLSGASSQLWLQIDPLRRE